MEKTVKRGSFGEDDRPYSEKYAGVPSEVLDAFIEESEKNPPKTWEEAWERSTDWEVEHGVRSVDG